MADTKTRAAGALCGVLFLAGCAGSSPAPVEDRGAGTWPATVSQGMEPARTGDSVSNAASPAGQAAEVSAAQTAGAATVIPLESGAANAPPRPIAVTPPTAAASPAVLALLDRADRSIRAGQHANAASSLERAIKIEPLNPWVWHRLAQTRFAQRRYGEAASLAAKSTSLAPAVPSLQAENWRLIARVHQARGEEVAARAAEDRARRLDTPRS